MSDFWGFVVKESCWLAADFQRERRKHGKDAKRINKICELSRKKLEDREAKRQKEILISLKKTSNRLSREVRKFWEKIEKLATIRIKQSFEREQQKYMNQHLESLIRQTKNYSIKMQNRMNLFLNKDHRKDFMSHRLISSQRNPKSFTSSCSTSAASDSSFGCDEEEEEDNESTLEAEEELERQERVREGKSLNYDDEIEMLKRESEMSVEDLRAMYSGSAEDVQGKDSEEESFDEMAENPSEGSDSSFGCDEEEEEDNESTLEAEEELERQERVREGKSLNYDDEIEMLKRESEMSVEDLRAMYSGSAEDVQGKDSEEESFDEMAENPSEGSDSSFGCDEEEEEDNESTLEAEEELERQERVREGKSLNYDDEIEMLKRESEMSVEDLRAMYSGSAEDVQGKDSEEESFDEMAENPSEGSDSSFGCDEEEEEDNESTLEAEEELERQERVREGKSLNYDDEIEMLKRESEMSVEDLRAKFSEKSSIGSDSHSKIVDSSSSNSSAFELSYLLSPSLNLRPYQLNGVRWILALHDLNINGILADEMGLGKTIQTIAAVSYLASNRGYWGPHLIVAPSSCLINWEFEFKRFCPGLKVLSYFGSAKHRRTLRMGWSKLNSFHVCITSYQLIVQDANIFKRKKWYYLILDEAHNIKNFKSKRWQTLLGFNTCHRLLLSGTPLQNNLLELWSLMHFLMPSVFSSRREFSFWFNNPLISTIERNSSVSPDLLRKLHQLIRPFILRRLKKDVATQLPSKHERLILCKMAKRQAQLYEEFMSKASIKSSLATGNYIGMMNTLMQLRKICNHPDLVEPRPVVTPFLFPGLILTTSRLASRPCIESKSIIWLDDFSQQPILEYHNAVEAPAATHLAEFLKWRKRSAFVVELGWRRRKQFSPSPWTSKMVHFVRLKSRDIYNWNSFLEHNSFILTFVIVVVAKIVATPVSLTIPCSSSLQYLFSINYVCLEGGVQFREALARQEFALIGRQQSISFPTKELVQYDSGKFQSLDSLLIRLKKGGHKCLIFTQMTKMLDLLEKFLNLHSYSYLRLDGSTSIEQRQMLMDRFNSDEKVFCFILSTRSGGLGINLVGADTVIFYDTDWNPTVDAQAQDRAHRIGQSREVFIYRFICESTVEQNILLKAHQKRKLDTMVISKGHFSADSLFSTQTLESAFGLLESDMPVDAPLSELMYEVEDEDDKKALSAFKFEVEEDKREFDESSTLEKEGVVKEDGDIDESSTRLELSSILKPVDIYALSISEANISRNTVFSNFETSDIESNLTDDSREEEDTDSDLIISSFAACRDLSSLFIWYSEERKKSNRLRVLRRLQGHCWKEIFVDSISYWFNEDTGELCYDTPPEIKRKEDYEESLRLKFNYIPSDVLVRILEFLSPLPDRIAAQRCCSRWHRTASDHKFFALFVNAVDRQTVSTVNNRRFFTTISEAVSAALPGETIILSPGHHWISNVVTISFPVKIIAEDEGCFVELNGKMSVDSTAIISINVLFRFHTIDSCFFFRQSTGMFLRCQFFSEVIAVNSVESKISIFESACRSRDGFIRSSKSSLFVHRVEIQDVRNPFHLQFSQCFLQDSVFNNCSNFIAVADSTFLIVQRCDTRKSPKCLLLNEWISNKALVVSSILSSESFKAMF